MWYRPNGADDYDSWIDHSILFTDAKVTAAMQTVIDRWNTPGMVFSNAGIAVNPFGDAIQDFDAGNCAMIRQASFAAAFLDDLPPIADGSAGAVDAFYNPGAAEGSKPLSTNFAFWDEGTLAVDGTKTVADVAAAIDAAWPN